MSSNVSHFFVHRRNSKGNHDSICTGCYMTIATAVEESALNQAEAQHVCQGINLERTWYGTH